MLPADLVPISGVVGLLIFDQRSPSKPWFVEQRGEYRLHSASNICYGASVQGGPQSKRRSGCPVSISLERFGDRWSLLIIRDLMVRGYRTYKEFQQSGEGIATNILANRLRKLRVAGIVRAESEGTDRRKVNYRLTRKGIDLAPVLLELLVWAARHEQTGAPCALIECMASNREQVLMEVRRRWQQRDSTPFLPRFGDASAARKSIKTRSRAKALSGMHAASS
jgi:DNA-binding HxlR family transcriptional regulator